MRPVFFLYAIAFAVTFLSAVYASPTRPAVFSIPPCSQGMWSSHPYYLTKTEPEQFLNATHNTTLSMCWTPDGLSVIETAEDEFPLSRSNRCNDNVWEDGAALELFISRVATPYDIPMQYFELDITPSTAVFGKIIHNNKGNVTTCPTCSTSDVIPCSGMGFFPEYPEMTHKVAILPTGWETTRFIPFQLFDKFIAPRNPADKNRLFRFNAYRYDYPKGLSEKEELSGASPTWSPSFHIPHRFAILHLVDKL